MSTPAKKKSGNNGTGDKEADTVARLAAEMQGLDVSGVEKKRGPDFQATPSGEPVGKKNSKGLRMNARFALTRGDLCDDLAMAAAGPMSPTTEDRRNTRKGEDSPELTTRSKRSRKDGGEGGSTHLGQPAVW